MTMKPDIDAIEARVVAWQETGDGGRDIADYMPAVIAYVRTLEALLTEHFDRDEYASRMNGQRDGDYWYCFDCKQQAREHDAIKHGPDCLRTRTAAALGLDKDAS